MNKIIKRIIGFVLVMSLLLQSLFINQFGIGYVNAAGDSYDFTEEVSVDTLTNDIDSM
ncbi:MAG: hypothetical protein K6E28_02400 [Eubacterium sp.]|nr:hypothetical protein [Eubacterium sp.]